MVQEDKMKCCIKKVITKNYSRLYCDECNMCLCDDGSERDKIHYTEEY